MKNFCNNSRDNLSAHIRLGATIFMISLLTALSTACAPPGNDEELEAAQQQSDRRRDHDHETDNVDRKPAGDEEASISKPAVKSETASTGAPKGDKKVQLAKFNPPAPKHTRRVWDPKPTLDPTIVGAKTTAPKVTKVALRLEDDKDEDVEVELGRTPKYNLPYNQELYGLGREAQKDMSIVCGEKPKKTTKVTHYYVPILKNFDSQSCHFIEGVCHFQKNGVTHVYNYDGGKKASPHKAVPLAKARCKSGIGYGIQENCTHPCRSLAASVTHHKPGEVIFFKNLVGMRCGIGKYAMIHDGFMIVNDTGAKKHFNHTGRFDFFFGPCRKKKNGICLEGGWDLSKVLTKSNYCRVWKPNAPTINTALKEKIYTVVRNEGIAKDDDQYASKVNVQQFIAYRTERGRRSTR